MSYPLYYWKQTYISKSLSTALAHLILNHVDYIRDMRGNLKLNSIKMNSTKEKLFDSIISDIMFIAITVNSSRFSVNFYVYLKYKSRPLHI